MSEDRRIVLFHSYPHAHCIDGFAAAWCAWTKMEDSAHYIPYVHKTPLKNLPLQDGDTVYMLDFAPNNRDELLELGKRCTVIVLDHHSGTAERVLQGVKPLPGLFNTPLPDGPGLYAHFDNTRSGALLAWWYFNSENRDGPPNVLKYIDDRDRWVFQYPNTKDIHAALMLAFTRPASRAEFQAFSYFLKGMKDEDGGRNGFFHNTVETGQIIRRAYDVQMEFVAKSAYQGEFDGYRTIFLNTPVHQSDLGHMLLELFPNAELALLWYVSDLRETHVGLRSRKGGPVNCANIAAKHNGDGHQGAAGFKSGNDPHTLGFI